MPYRCNGGCWWIAVHVRWPQTCSQTVIFAHLLQLSPAILQRAVGHSWSPCSSNTDASANTGSYSHIYYHLKMMRKKENHCFSITLCQHDQPLSDLFPWANTDIQELIIQWYRPSSEDNMVVRYSFISVCHCVLKNYLNCFFFFCHLEYSFDLQ